MSQPLAKRVKRLFLWCYSISIGLVLMAAWMLLEGIEETTLEIDKQAEVEHLLNLHDLRKPAQARSSMLTISYLPAKSLAFDTLPIIFSDLPVPFDGEVTFLDKEYRIIIDQIPEGTYYLAKDLSRFEAYENWVIGVLVSLAGLAVVGGIMFSSLISRRIAQPIQALTDNIQRVKQGQHNTYLPDTFEDSELNEISTQLNHYLHQIDDMIVRERSLVTMASHELRTPIAVIMGAAEVLEHRNQLKPNDQKTLARIMTAANTMSTNVNALMSLVRRSKTELDTQWFSLNKLVNELLLEKREHDPEGAERLEVRTQSEVNVRSNRDMLKILLSNLVNNGLTHNQGRVTIEFSQSYMLVKDEAIPSSDEMVANADQNQTSGLGLYIVTLICKRMGWQFALTTSKETHTLARIVF